MNTLPWLASFSLFGGEIAVRVTQSILHSLWQGPLLLLRLRRPNSQSLLDDASAAERSSALDELRRLNDAEVGPGLRKRIEMYERAYRLQSALDALQKKKPSTETQSSEPDAAVDAPSLNSQPSPDPNHSTEDPETSNEPKVLPDDSR